VVVFLLFLLEPTRFVYKYERFRRWEREKEREAGRERERERE
jgi:hypothetical protein